jgi:hypothetical protein
MMSKISLLLTAALWLGLSTASVRAAEPADTTKMPVDVGLLADTIRVNRQALVAVNLDLTAEEAAGFWPLYERYRQEIDAIGDRIVAVVEDYVANFRDLSNEKALQLTEDYLAAEADRAKLRRDYLDEFAKILPGRKIARLYQIENKMDAVVRYEMAVRIPVIEEKSAAPPQ